MIALLLRTALYLVRALPKPVWVAIMRFLAFVASWLPFKEKRKIIANYHKIDPVWLKTYREDHPGGDARRFAREVFFHQGLMAVETIRFSYDRDSVTIDGLDAYRELITARPEGTGAIILTGHIGSWEMLGAATAKVQGKPFAALAKAPDHPAVKKALVEYRKRLDVTLLWNVDPDLMGKMFEILQAGDGLGMVIDQKPKSRRGVTVDFLGEPTLMVNGPIRVARKTSATLYGVYCLRVKPFHYRIVCEYLADAEYAATLKDQPLGQILSDSMASAIAQAPTQWAWNYKRWSPPRSRGSRKRASG